MARKIILFAALFFVALASGGAFVVYLVYNPAGLSAEFYVDAMQHAIRVMNPLAVFLNLGLLFTIISAALARRDRPNLYLLIAAGLCIIGSVLITVLGNWPINDQIITWSSHSPPTNWQELANQWFRLHVARFVGLILGLSLIILSTLLRRENPKIDY